MRCYTLIFTGAAMSIKSSEKLKEMLPKRGILLLALGAIHKIADFEQSKSAILDLFSLIQTLVEKAQDAATGDHLSEWLAILSFPWLMVSPFILDKICPILLVECVHHFRDKEPI